MLVVLVLLVATMSVGEARAQDQSRDGIRLRFKTVTATAAGFVHVYTSSLLAREGELARLRLNGPHPTQAGLVAFDQDLGLGPTVLLDSRGRLLLVTPSKPSLIGADIAAQDGYLNEAEHGVPNVSVVVSSAAEHVPVVAFAAPFVTAYGRRVVSGGISVASTPLGPYLHNLYPVIGTKAFLIDSNGRALSSTSPSSPSLALLAPELSSDIADGPPSGEAHGTVYNVVAVPGTPWRLVTVCSAAALFRPLDQLNHYMPWVYVGVVAAMALALGCFILRTREQRYRMAVLADIDSLTGTANRRRVEADLRAACSAASRHGQELALMMVDIDHFKRVNDTLGHKSGDEVLQEVARRLGTCLRAEDSLGRWGGEEFLIVLPFTGRPGAAALAGRLLDVVRAQPFRTGEYQLTLTTSIGTAVASPGTSPDALLAAADAALYRAKGAGRDRAELTMVGGQLTAAH